MPKTNQPADAKQRKTWNELVFIINFTVNEQIRPEQVDC